MLHLGLFTVRQNAISFLEKSAPSPEKEWKCEDLFKNSRDCIIGRSSKCAVYIEDWAISRKHAQVTKIDETMLCITDLGSKNGIAVDDRVCRHALIGHGSIIEIARVFLLVYDSSIVYRDTDPSKRTLPGKL